MYRAQVILNDYDSLSAKLFTPALKYKGSEEQLERYLQILERNDIELKAIKSKNKPRQ